MEAVPQASASTLELIIALVQVLSLVALVVYVIKTWEMASATRKSVEITAETLSEMRKTRDADTAPYVIVYLDIGSGQWINLVISNAGRSIATDISLTFAPPLQVSKSEITDHIALLAEGIGALAPGQEMRTFLDAAHAYFGHVPALPTRYQVTVSYHGGLSQDERRSEQTLDLGAYRGLMALREYDTEDLVKEVHDLTKELSKVKEQIARIAAQADRGFTIGNPGFFVTPMPLAEEEWKQAAIGAVRGFISLWEEDYEREPSADFVRDMRLLRSQLLVILSQRPNGIESGMVQRISQIAQEVGALARVRLRFFNPGPDFERHADDVANEVRALIEESAPTTPSVS